MPPVEFSNHPHVSTYKGVHIWFDRHNCQPHVDHTVFVSTRPVFTRRCALSGQRAWCVALAELRYRSLKR